MEKQLINLSFPLSSESWVYFHDFWLFSLRIDKPAIVELNWVIKSELEDINLEKS